MKRFVILAMSFLALFAVMGCGYGSDGINLEYDDGSICIDIDQDLEIMDGVVVHIDTTYCVEIPMAVMDQITAP